MRIKISFLLALFCFSSAQAADITLSGNWSETINRNDLVSGAGSDIRSPIESDVSQATLDITNTEGASWTVTVSKSNSNWPAGVSLAVKRTSNGTGTGTISGGTAYLTLSSMTQTFFSGSGDLGNIQLQLKTEGLSVENAPDIYSATITYTLQ